MSHRDPAVLDKLAQESEGFSGAEIAEAVVASCFNAFAERRALVLDDVLKSIRNTVPLSVTQGERVAEIRGWAGTRAVSATSERHRDEYKDGASGDSSDISSWRGGRAIEF